VRGSVGMHSDSPHGRPSMPDQEFRFSGTEVHGHIIVPIRRTCDDANGPAGYYLIPGPITTSIARKCHSGCHPGLRSVALIRGLQASVFQGMARRTEPHIVLILVLASPIQLVLG